MNTRNYAVIVIILLLVAAVVGFLAFKVNSMSDGIKAAYEEKATADLAEQLNLNDYQIYWIGEVPEYLELISDHITVLTVGQANYNTLPVNEGNTSMTVYDQDGNVLSSREQRDYADNMLIVINTNDEISEEKWDIIRNCTVDNRVPVLLIGNSSIDAFREYMILIGRDTNAYSSMLFEFSRTPVDDPVDPAVIEAGGRGYANALMEFFLSRIDNPVVVYVSSDETAVTVTTQETDITEETNAA